WTPEFQLSLERLHADPAMNAQMRAHLMEEYAAMPESLLRLHAETARDEAGKSSEARARLYIAFLAGNQRRLKEPIMIGDVEVPQIGEVQKVFAQIDGYAAEVQLHALDVNGAPAQRAERLT